MRSPVCYLAQPIDFQVDVAPSNADYVRNSLLEAGFVVYSPARAFSTPPSVQLGPAIWAIDQYALRQSDALVALYPEKESIGVPMELQCAVDLGIPVYVISRADKRSWVLAGLADMTGVRVSHYPGKDTNFDWLLTKAHERMLGPVSDNQSLRFRIDAGAQLPTRAYADDAGFDLYCVDEMEIAPNGTADIPSGVAVQLPEGVWAIIVGRSSTLRKHNLLVNTGIIDTGFRGQLFTNVKNLGAHPFEVKRGMRLAQLIPLPNVAAGLVPTPIEQLSPSDRGEAGFGSSGE